VERILILRTDRIGDFLITSPIISSIIKKVPNAKIDIICSDLNYDYIKTFKVFNNIFLYPKNFFKKILFYLKLPKYSVILVLDGKKRSIYISLLKKSNIKILLTPSNFLKSIFKYFFNKIYLIDYKQPKINLIKKIIEDINCKYENDHLNFLKNFENIENLKTYLDYDDFILLNFDEKWIFDLYLKTYQNIEPNLNDFIVFLNDLSKKNKKVIISNGFKENKILNQCSQSGYFLKNKNVILKNNISIFELQFLIKKCNTLITCHGAPSHIASNYNKRIIDIIDVSEKNFFESYNFHFLNKTQIIRSDFKKLSKEILSVV